MSNRQDDTTYHPDGTGPRDEHGRLLSPLQDAAEEQKRRAAKMAAKPSPKAAAADRAATAERAQAPAAVAQPQATETSSQR